MLKKCNFDNLENIILEEAYEFPPRGIHRVLYLLRIEKDGFIEEKIFEDNTSSTIYQTNQENVEKLYNTLTDTIDNVVDVDVALDDISRNISINYKNFLSESIPSLAYGKDEKSIEEIIEEFLEKDCIKREM